MRRSATRRAATLRSWRHAAQAMPRIAASVVRHGMLPAGLSTANTLRREGIGELHWKVLGDGLVRFLRHAGPVFTKFGQILATRPDLLPPTVCARLESLYTEQAPMRRRQLARALRSAYGPEHPFRTFDAEPMAVGSIGQVHRARLESGEAVIVKILRPDVGKKIERDLAVAAVLMDVFFAARRSGRAERALLAQCLDDLARGYVQEVDLEHEAAALRTFARSFEKNPNVCVPRCFDGLSSKSVLVMEELVGEPLSTYRRRARHNPKAAQRIANLALSEILKQIFEDGRFHADPHAGNLLVLEDGRLGIIDLGLTGELSPGDRRRIVRAVKAFLARDADGLLQTLLEFGTTPPDFDKARFQADVVGVVQRNGRAVVSELRGQNEARKLGETSNSLEAFVTALFRVATDHGVCVPPSTTLLIKTLVTIEGVARSLHPELNLATVAVPVLLRAATPRWMKWVLGARA